MRGGGASNFKGSSNEGTACIFKSNKFRTSTIQNIWSILNIRNPPLIHCDLHECAMHELPPEPWPELSYAGASHRSYTLFEVCTHLTTGIAAVDKTLVWPKAGVLAWGMYLFLVLNGFWPKRRQVYLSLAKIRWLWPIQIRPLKHHTFSRNSHSGSGHFNIVCLPKSKRRLNQKTHLTTYRT